MFFFRADTILREIECHLPQLGEFVAACDDAARRGDEASFVQEAYAGLPRVSIDYGVMEKADDILVVPGRFGWDDIGSWSAAWELARKDDEGNARGGGEQLAVDARGCYTTTRDGKLVALIGVEDLIVVDTGDALLVMPRDRAQDVRAVVDALREGERDEYL
jgi:mannose-1-phosphate guanylyltransferase